MSKTVPTPVTVLNSKKSHNFYNNSAVGNVLLQRNLIGGGHQGPEVMERIVMSLKSGIESEVKWALSFISQLSCSDPHLLNFEKTPYLGNELMAYFFVPFNSILTKKQVDTDKLSIGLDALLALRNSAQDLVNQQWLSQIKAFKKHIIEVFNFLIDWFYQDSEQTYALHKNNDLFKEALNYTVDLIENLSCYYIDNTKNDVLFNSLLKASILVNDKYLFVNILKSLTHLLIMRNRNQNTDDSNRQEDEVELTPNNCIDVFSDEHLSVYVNFLLTNDNDLNYAVLNFIKGYLNSQALHPSHPHSLKLSQNLRLRKLLQLDSTQGNFHTLVKQLPLLIVSNLPLLNPSKINDIQPINLTKRSSFVSVPDTLPSLPKDLYDIIAKFPEPLRATTWLRCCYEPFYDKSTKSRNGNGVPGEVTQISLWKAYEKQFEEIWQTSKTQPNPEWPSLLPAVDFIKNVNNAFPNSEAMVVNFESEVPGQAAKKKFIIKGIQPRHYVVSIDVANYEALKHADSFSDAEEKENLPVGHIDVDKFYHSINNVFDQILEQGGQVGLKLKSKDLNPINTLSKDLLEHIINEVLETEADSNDLENAFRFYNSHWLPKLIYSNPSLVESEIVSSKWLKYLI